MKAGWHGIFMKEIVLADTELRCLAHFSLCSSPPPLYLIYGGVCLCTCFPETCLTQPAPFPSHVSHPMGSGMLAGLQYVSVLSSCLLQLFKVNMLLLYGQFFSETPAAWARTSWYSVQPSRYSDC